MPAQIWKDKPIPRDQGLSRRFPQFMMGRKGMKQNHRRPVAKDFVKDLRVTARHLFHGPDLNTGAPGKPILVGRRTKISTWQ